LGEVGIDPLAEPGLLLAPAQPLIQQDLVDAAALDGDPLPLIEIRLQAVQRPTAERQSQVVRLGQGRGDDLSSLRGGVGRGAARPRPVLQPG
jgi:hypothetical protein